MATQPFYVNRRQQNGTQRQQNGIPRLHRSNDSQNAIPRPPSVQTTQTIVNAPIHIHPHQFTTFAVPLPHLEQATPSKDIADIEDDLNQILGLGTSDSDQPICAPPYKKHKKQKKTHKKKKKHKKQNKDPKDLELKDLLNKVESCVDKKIQKIKNEQTVIMQSEIKQIKEKYNKEIEKAKTTQNAMESEMKKIRTFNAQIVDKNKDLMKGIEIKDKLNTNIMNQNKGLMKEILDMKEIFDEKDKKMNELDKKSKLLEHENGKLAQNNLNELEKYEELKRNNEKYEELKRILKENGSNTGTENGSNTNNNINTNIFNKDKISVFNEDKDMERLRMNRRDFDLNEYIVSLDKKKKYKNMAIKYKNMAIEYKEKLAKFEVEMKGLKSKINTMESSDWKGEIIDEYEGQNGNILYQMRWNDTYGLNRNDVNRKDLSKWESNKKQNGRKRKRSNCDDDDEDVDL